MLFPLVKWNPSSNKDNTNTLSHTNPNDNNKLTKTMAFDLKLKMFLSHFIFHNPNGANLFYLTFGLLILSFSYLLLFVIILIWPYCCIIAALHSYYLFLLMYPSFGYRILKWPLFWPKGFKSASALVNISSYLPLMSSGGVKVNTLPHLADHIYLFISMGSQFTSMKVSTAW